MKNRANKVVQFLCVFLVAYCVLSVLNKDIPYKDNHDSVKIPLVHISDKAEKTPSSDFMNIVFQHITIQIDSLLQKISPPWLAYPVARILCIFLFCLIIIRLVNLLFKHIILQRLLTFLSSYIEHQTDKKELDTLPILARHLFILLIARGFVTFFSFYMHFDLTLINQWIGVCIIGYLTFFMQKMGVLLLSIWLRSVSKTTGARLDKELLPISIVTLKIFIMIIGVFTALSALHVDLMPFLTSLGAFTFALGFAVKDSLSNLIAGIFLILDKSFQVGNKIEIPDICTGYIHQIGFRTIQILTFDREIIVIPNNVMMNKFFKNYALPDTSIRVVVKFGVAYGTNVVQVKNLILPLLNQDSDLLQKPDPPVVEFLSMDDFTLSFCVKAYVSDYTMQYRKTLELTEKIHDALNQAKIEIPFPTQTLYLQKPKD